jgi:hypothetical protein
MPKLYLDDLWVLMNGRFWWGFNKEMTSVVACGNRYAVTSLAGQRLVSVEWSAEENGVAPPGSGSAQFEPIRQMLNQTLISETPAATGVFFSLTDFDRKWNLSTVTPLRCSLEVDPAYINGFEGGLFTASEKAGIASSAPSAFEVSGPWWLSLPYQKIFSD